MLAALLRGDMVPQTDAGYSQQVEAFVAPVTARSASDLADLLMPCRGRAEKGEALVHALFDAHVIARGSLRSLLSQLIGKVYDGVLLRAFKNASNSGVDGNPTQALLSFVKCASDAARTFISGATTRVSDSAAGEARARSVLASLEESAIGQMLLQITGTLPAVLNRGDVQVAQDVSEAFMSLVEAMDELVHAVAKVYSGAFAMPKPPAETHAISGSDAQIGMKVVESAHPYPDNADIHTR